MAGGGWAPIDPPGPGEVGQDATASGDTRTGAPPPPAPPPAPPPQPRAAHPLARVPPWRLAGGAPFVIVGLLLLVGVLAESAADQTPPRAAPTSASTSPPDTESSTTSEPPPSAEELAGEARRLARATFADAGERLRGAGSFAYSGEVEITATSLLRPATRLAGRLTVQGQVSLPRRIREIAIDESGRAFETVLVGPGVWERGAATADALPAVPLELTARRERGELGAALVPEWLEMAEDQASLGETPGGGQRYQAAVRYHDGPDDMVVTLDVDDHGVPTHVRLASGSTSLVIDLAITAIGEPVDIATPGGRPAGIVPTVTSEELAAAGIVAPVQPTRIPTGWFLGSAWLEHDWPRAGCAVLHLSYWRIDGEAGREEGLDLDVQAEQCVPAYAPGSLAFTAGAYSGLITGPDAERNRGHVSDSTTGIGFETSLSAEDVRHVLETVQPYDPTIEPTQTDALAAS